MLDIIRDELCRNNIEYKILDGRTPQKDRSVIISDFEEGPATVFLISLKAGGTGLKLTSADTVIHCDPWWNPSVEEQASARAYRIGQKNCVQIIYLIAGGTIEEKINEVKLQKDVKYEYIIPMLPFCIERGSLSSLS
jgi:SNF2 family DNA or RNA helicase